MELLPELAEAGQHMCRRWEEAMARLRNDAKESVDDGGVGGGGGTLDPLPQLRVAEGDILEVMLVGERCVAWGFVGCWP